MRTITCTAEKFRNLVNPYTGEPVEVKMLLRDNGGPLFFAPDTFSTTDYYPSVAELINSWDRVNGLGGTKSRDVIRCAYTGEPLRIEENVAGFHFVGGFSPRALTTDDEFLYYATMRNGVPIMKKPNSVSRVTAMPEQPEEMPKVLSDEVRATDEALHIAEKVVNEFKDPLGMKNERTVVSMSKKRGRR